MLAENASRRSTPPRVAVAYSGGRDSTALLHATARVARELGCEVWALHVHHGLSPLADVWLAHARHTCEAWCAQGLPLHLLSRKVAVAAASGDSVEAQARAARYAALADMAHEVGTDLVLLAHHRRDQAETFLLQALRGGGVAGLSAMPADAWRSGVRWVRPWLRHPRECVEAYVARHGLSYVEDDSNAHLRHARNRLRLLVWPALTQAFPEAEKMLACSAFRVADALPAVQDWRESLLADLSVGETGLDLDAVAWSDLTGAGRREVLAHWYRRRSGQTLGATWIERLASEVPGLVFRKRVSRWPALGVSLYRGVLYWHPPLSIEAVQGGRLSMPVAPQSLCINAPGEYALPSWGGVLRVSDIECGGVPWTLLQTLWLKPRCGGEQFQAGPGRPPRSLKKQYQSRGVPAWEREGPLVFSGESLVFAPGLGFDSRFLASPGAPQATLEWVPAHRNDRAAT